MRTKDDRTKTTGHIVAATVFVIAFPVLDSARVPTWYYPVGAVVTLITTVVLARNLRSDANTRTR